LSQVALYISDLHSEIFPKQKVRANGEEEKQRGESKCCEENGVGEKEGEKANHEE
jgi:hypothetical protein